MGLRCSCGVYRLGCCNPFVVEAPKGRFPSSQFSGRWLLFFGFSKAGLGGFWAFWLFACSTFPVPLRAFGFCSLSWVFHYFLDCWQIGLASISLETVGIECSTAALALVDVKAPFVRTRDINRKPFPRSPIDVKAQFVRAGDINKKQTNTHTHTPFPRSPNGRHEKTSAKNFRTQMLGLASAFNGGSH